MPYEHAPEPTYEAPRARGPFLPPPLRPSLAAAVVATVLIVAAVAMGVWRDQGRWIWVLLVILLVSRPIGWLLWTRRRS